MNEALEVTLMVTGALERLGVTCLLGGSLASPEDVVLQKLIWYRKGGEASERQWRDVIGVLEIGGQALDLSYLATAAARAGVTDLLDRAREEAGRKG